MHVSGSRYALQKHHRGRWITVAATDDLALLDKMLGDQHQHVSRPAVWRTFDRVHDKVLAEVQKPAR